MEGNLTASGPTPRQRHNANDTSPTTDATMKHGQMSPTALPTTPSKGASRGETPEPSMPVPSDKHSKRDAYKAQKRTYRSQKKEAAKELLSTITDPAVVLLGDWLKVRGTLKSWTKLWCVLKPGLLILYKSDKHKGSQWVGTILLNTCQLLERPSKKDGFCFKLFHPLDQSIWATKGPKGETIGAFVQPLPYSYCIFRAPSESAGKCWMDALELALKCTSLLKRSMTRVDSASDTTVDYHSRRSLTQSGGTWAAGNGGEEEHGGQNSTSNDHGDDTFTHSYNSMRAQEGSMDDSDLERHFANQDVDGVSKARENVKQHRGRGRSSPVHSDRGPKDSLLCPNCRNCNPELLQYNYYQKSPDIAHNHGKKSSDRSVSKIPINSDRLGSTKTGVSSEISLKQQRIGDGSGWNGPSFSEDCDLQSKVTNSAAGERSSSVGHVLHLKGSIASIQKSSGMGEIPSQKSADTSERISSVRTHQKSPLTRDMMALKHNSRQEVGSCYSPSPQRPQSAQSLPVFCETKDRSDSMPYSSVTSPVVHAVTFAPEQMLWEGKGENSGPGFASKNVHCGPGGVAASQLEKMLVKTAPVVGDKEASCAISPSSPINLPLNMHQLLNSDEPFKTSAGLDRLPGTRSSLSNRLPGRGSPTFNMHQPFRSDEPYQTSAVEGKLSGGGSPVYDTYDGYPYAEAMPDVASFISQHGVPQKPSNVKYFEKLLQNQRHQLKKVINSKARYEELIKDNEPLKTSLHSELTAGKSVSPSVGSSCTLSSHSLSPQNLSRKGKPMYSVSSGKHRMFSGSQLPEVDVSCTPSTRSITLGGDISPQEWQAMEEGKVRQKILKFSQPAKENPGPVQRSCRKDRSHQHSINQSFTVDQGTQTGEQGTHQYSHGGDTKKSVQLSSVLKKTDFSPSPPIPIAQDMLYTIGDTESDSQSVYTTASTTDSQSSQSVTSETDSAVSSKSGTSVSYTSKGKKKPTESISTTSAESSSSGSERSDSPSKASHQKRKKAEKKKKVSGKDTIRKTVSSQTSLTDTTRSVSVDVSHLSTASRQASSVDVEPSESMTSTDYNESARESQSSTSSSPSRTNIRTTRPRRAHPHSACSGNRSFSNSKRQHRKRETSAKESKKGKAHKSHRKHGKSDSKKRKKSKSRKEEGAGGEKKKKKLKDQSAKGSKSDGKVAGEEGGKKKKKKKKPHEEGTGGEKSGTDESGAEGHHKKKKKKKKHDKEGAEGEKAGKTGEEGGEKKKEGEGETSGDGHEKGHHKKKKKKKKHDKEGAEGEKAGKTGKEGGEKKKEGEGETSGDGHEKGHHKKKKKKKKHEGETGGGEEKKAHVESKEESTEEGHHKKKKKKKKKHHEGAEGEKAGQTGEEGGEKKKEEESEGSTSGDGHEKGHHKKKKKKKKKKHGEEGAEGEKAGKTGEEGGEKKKEGKGETSGDGHEKGHHKKKKKKKKHKGETEGGKEKKMQEKSKEESTEEGHHEKEKEGGEESGHGEGDKVTPEAPTKSTSKEMELQPGTSSAPDTGTAEASAVQAAPVGLTSETSDTAVASGAQSSQSSPVTTEVAPSSAETGSTPSIRSAGAAPSSAEELVDSKSSVDIEKKGSAASRGLPVSQTSEEEVSISTASSVVSSLAVHTEQITSTSENDDFVFDMPLFLQKMDAWVADHEPKMDHFKSVSELTQLCPKCVEALSHQGLTDKLFGSEHPASANGPPVFVSQKFKMLPMDDAQYASSGKGMAGAGAGASHSAGSKDHQAGSNTGLDEDKSEQEDTETSQSEFEEDVRPGHRVLDPPEETSYLINKQEELGQRGDECQTEEVNEENKGLIWTLVKQVRPGMDLSKVVLPTFILEPRSFLDKLSDYYYHADILSGAVLEESPYSRIKSVVKWYLSGFYKKPKGLKKPYNPVIGEVFRCCWHHPATGSRTFYVAEQVSHHPPVSVFHVTNRKDGFNISGSILARSKFYGNSLSAFLDGVATLSFLERGEDYFITMPYAHCKGILIGTLTMELGGKVTIDCPKTGYKCELEFKLKPFLGSGQASNRVHGKILMGADLLASIDGHWDQDIYIKDRALDKKREVFWDPTPEVRARRLRRCTVPLTDQCPYESERLWERVSKAVMTSDMQAATNEKYIVEEEQRKNARDRKLNKTEWVPRYFEKDFLSGGDWIYRHADDRPWDPVNDVYQYEKHFVIQTQTRHKTPHLRANSINSVNKNVEKKKLHLPLCVEESDSSGHGLHRESDSSDYRVSRGCAGSKPMKMTQENMTQLLLPLVRTQQETGKALRSLQQHMARLDRQLTGGAGEEHGQDFLTTNWLTLAVVLILQVFLQWVFR